MSFCILISAVVSLHVYFTGQHHQQSEKTRPFTLPNWEWDTDLRSVTFIWQCIVVFFFYLDLADIHTEHRLDCGHTGLYYRWKRKQGSRYENIFTSSKYNTNNSSQLLTLLHVGWNADGIYRCSYYDNEWYDVDFYLIVQGK